MFDRKLFYSALRPKLGSLTQANVVGFEAVLDEALKRGTALQSLSYICGTAWWETGKTMQPVREAYWLSEAWRKKNLRYYPFYGRGHVQLTWEANYAKIGKFYGLDLVGNPDRVMDMDLSVRILFDGMEQGWFTGKDLADYIDNVDEDDAEDMREYANARRIVNGVDRQIEIADLALAFENALRTAGWGEAAEPAPVPAADPFLAKLAEMRVILDDLAALR